MQPVTKSVALPDRNLASRARRASAGRFPLLCCGTSAARYAVKVLECSGKLAHHLGPLTSALAGSAQLSSFSPQLSNELRKHEQQHQSSRPVRVEHEPGAVALRQLRAGGSVCVFNGL